MADPLSLLRTYVINKKEIIEHDDEIILGDFAWPKGVKTNFVMCGSDRNGAPKDYYTLESLVLFVKNCSDPHTIYVRQAAVKNIPSVRRPDRKTLLAYLHGDIVTCASVDKSALFNLPKQVKRGADSKAEQDKNTKKPKLEEKHVQKVKEQLVARLDAPKEGSVSMNKIKSLSDAMSVEKIAEIKAKRLANKRITIQENDDVLENKEYDIKVLLDSDADKTKYIFSKEREWRNRLTILQATEKKFDKSVLALLNRVTIREEQGAKPPLPPPVVQRTPIVKPSPYNRYDQEQFDKKFETVGFQINTMESYHGEAIKTISEAANMQFKVADVAPQFPLPSLPEQAQHGGNRVYHTPIIIIPAAGTSLISLFNVKDILQDLKFVTTEQKKKENCRPSNEVLILRQLRERSITASYRVVNIHSRLSREEWDRVVAVFVLGPTWQFKGFPWTNPVEIFSKICAFHIKYDETELDSNVGRWAVTVINLCRTRRHLDRAALMVFWEKLDIYMKNCKPHLRL